MNATSGELPGPGITQARAAQPFRITAALSYLMLLGGLLTVVYMIGLIFRPRRLLGPLGLDSAAVVVVYALGIVGLVFIAR